VLAGKEGRIQMALRNTLDTLTIVTTGSVASTLMNGPTATRVSGGRRVVVRQSRNQTTVVEGFRGGEKTLSRFSESSAPSPDRGSP
jgi:hypothetical protein